MVLIWPFAGMAIEGYDIKGARVCIAGCNLSGQIVIGIEYPATTLKRQYLERQVSVTHLARVLHSSYELLIKLGLEAARIFRPQRVDGIKSDTSLS